MSNTGGVYTWSKTATANASADSTVNYAEGQAPSSLNDSAARPWPALRNTAMIFPAHS
jgi:hypothetical protein